MPPRYAGSRYARPSHPLALLLAAVAAAVLGGARAQGACPITAEQLKGVDYSSVRVSCVPPPAGSPPPCTACLCDIGRALFEGLGRGGVNVSELVGSGEAGALQGLFQACQMAVGVELITGADLDVALLTQLLSCPSDAVSAECIAPVPASTPDAETPLLIAPAPTPAPVPAPVPAETQPGQDEDTATGSTDGGSTTSGPVSAAEGPKDSDAAAAPETKTPLPQPVVQPVAVPGSVPATAPAEDAKPKPVMQPMPMPETGDGSGGPSGGTGGKADGGSTKPATQPTDTPKTVGVVGGNGPTPAAAPATKPQGGAASALNALGWPVLLLALIAAFAQRMPASL